MDRTSILGDTIDYVKELLGKIDDLKQEDGFGEKQSNVFQLLKEMKPNEMVVRNSPKVTKKEIVFRFRFMVLVII